MKYIINAKYTFSVEARDEEEAVSKFFEKEKLNNESDFTSFLLEHLQIIKTK